MARKLELHIYTRAIKTQLSTIATIELTHTRRLALSHDTCWCAACSTVAEVCSSATGSASHSCSLLLQLVAPFNFRD